MNMLKKDKYVFPAIFDYADDGISVSFPDLPGCFTCGKTDEEALRMAKDALGGHIWVLEDIESDIPEPTQLVNVSIENNQRALLVEVYMPLFRDAVNNQSVKKTLTIPAWMNEAAEKEGINFSQLLREILQAAN